MDPRCAPVHASLVRPLLVAGVEPRIVVLEGTLVSALLLGVGFSTPTLLASVLIVFVVHPLLALMSKADPLALAVYARATTYQAFFPSSAHPDCPAGLFPPFDEIL